MLSLDFQSISELDLQRLIDEQVSEGETLEYKEQLNLDPIDAKLEFLKDISAMANAKGGDVIFGMGEDSNHKPLELVPLKNFIFDEWKRRISDLALAHLEPKLFSLAFKEVPLTRGGFAAIIRVSKSWAGPHMVKIKDDYRFYMRVGSQKKTMTAIDLRNAFLETEAIPERLRSFRQQRLKKIMNQETPRELSYENGQIVLHLLSLASFTENLSIDLEKLKQNPSDLIPLTKTGYSTGFILTKTRLWNMPSDDSVIPRISGKFILKMSTKSFTVAPSR